MGDLEEVIPRGFAMRRGHRQKLLRKRGPKAAGECRGPAAFARSVQTCRERSFSCEGWESSARKAGRAFSRQWRCEVHDERGELHRAGYDQCSCSNEVLREPDAGIHYAFDLSHTCRISKLLLEVACCNESRDAASLCSTGLSSEVEDLVLSPWQEALARADRSAREYVIANKVRGEATSCRGSLLVRDRCPQRQLPRTDAYHCRLVELLSLACPDAARSVNLEKALIHVEHSSLCHRACQRPRGPPLKKKLLCKRAMRASRAPDACSKPRDKLLINVALNNFIHKSRCGIRSCPRHNDSNAELLILPEHCAAFVRTMQDFKKRGYPCKPCLAFHSTPYVDAYDGISRNNFDPQKCGRHDAGYYGRGTYFHTNSPNGGAGSSHTFFALILKGREYELTYRLGCPLEPGFDSHIASDRKNSGETVIFKKDQMLPVFCFDT